MSVLYEAQICLVQTDGEVGILGNKLKTSKALWFNIRQTLIMGKNYQKWSMNETSQDEFMFVSFEWTDLVELPLNNIPHYRQLYFCYVSVEWSDPVIEVRPAGWF